MLTSFELCGSQSFADTTCLAHSKIMICRVSVVLLSKVHHLFTAWKSDSTRRKGHHYSD